LYISENIAQTIDFDKKQKSLIQQPTLFETI